MVFQRARSEKDKETRVNDIVSASSEIYDEKKYNGITFDAIAKRLNATRPLIYKYFSTKEEIVAEILKHDFSAWAKDLKKTFKSDRDYNVDEISDEWTECIARHGRMVELYSMMHTVLENNMSSEKLADVLVNITSTKNSLIKLLRRISPKLDDMKSSFFFESQMSLAAGMYPAYKSTHTTRKKDDYKELYSRNLSIILHNLTD